MDESTETWPDPEDVTGWLETLEAGVKLSEERLAAELAHLERCRAAATDVAATTAGSEASQRLCLLMHGGLIDPTALEPDEIEEAAPLWTPPTKEQREQRRATEQRQRNERYAAEQRRRIALAEQQFGVPFEGVDIEVPSRKRCPDCGHRFAGATHDPAGKGCDIVIAGIGTRTVERCGCMTDPQAHGMTAAGVPVSEPWRVDLPSPLLARALHGDVNDDEEMQRAREELERHGVVRPRPPREPGSMLTRVEET